MAVKFSAMRQQINQLHQTIREVEQLSTTGDHNADAEGSVVNLEAKASTASDEAPNGSPPPNSGSAAPSSPVARSSQAEEGSGVVQES